MSTTLTAEEKLKLVDTLKEISASMARMDAERDVLKQLKKDICDELDMNRKVLNKLARLYYKGNFSEEKELNTSVEELYQRIGGK